MFYIIGDGLTVFAPTNAAFSRLGSHVLHNLDRNPRLLKGKFKMMYASYYNSFLYFIKLVSVTAGGRESPRGVDFG